jgi:hypothetical protein
MVMSLIGVDYLEILLVQHEGMSDDDTTILLFPFSFLNDNGWHRQHSWLGSTFVNIYFFQTGFFFTTS